MAGQTVPHAFERISALVADRLHLRGHSLTLQLQRARRHLPWRVRREAAILSEAETLWQNPRLHRRIDLARLERAARNLERHLRPLGAAERRRALLMGILASLAFNMLAVAGLLMGVLVWRGYL